MKQKASFDGDNSIMSEIAVSDGKAPHVVMSAWTPENWEGPTTFEPFPILDICPDAPAIFAAAGHFTIRDLRAIIAKFGLPLDPKDQQNVYRNLLEITQSAPWIFPIVEAAAADSRGRQGAVKFKKKPVSGHVVSKMPLSKLRLKARPELHDRVDELKFKPVDPALAVSAFAEYAILAFEAMGKARGLKALTEEALVRFGAKPAAPVADRPTAEPTTVSSEVRFGDLDKVTDWTGHADEVLAFAEEHPEEVSEHLYQHVLEAARALARGAGSLTSPSDLIRVGRVFCLAGRLAELLPTPEREEVTHQLTSLGFEVHGEVSDKAIEILSSAFNGGLWAGLRSLEERMAALEGSVTALRWAIAQAVAEENYTHLKELSGKAEAERAALAEVSSKRSALVQLVNGVLSGDREDGENIFAEMRALLPEMDSSAPILDRTDKAFDDNEETLAAEGVDDDGPLPPADPEEGYGASEVDANISAETGKKEEDPIPLEEVGSEPEQDVPDPVPPAPGTTDHVPDQARDYGVEGSTVAQDETNLSGPEPHSGDAPVPETILASLIDRGLLAVAFDAASTFEAAGFSWPIPAAVLQAAAASRAAQRDYGADTQRFLEITTTARSAARSDLSSSLLLGALLRPALSDPSSGFRSGLLDLCRGAIGQHLIKAAEAISELDYDFPPDPDELARLSGTQSKPQKSRIAEKLESWRKTMSARSSRWPFATSFMHHVVSDVGLIGAAVVAIGADQPNAAELAQRAIGSLSAPAAIDAAAEEFAHKHGRATARLHPKGREYLERQFDEALGLLDRWVRASTRDAGTRQQSEARLRTTISNLVSRLEKAFQGLTRELSASEGSLEGAVIGWIRLQIEGALAFLRGGHNPAYATLDDALTAERDLLPASVRDALDLSGDAYDVFVEALRSDNVPDPEEAYRRARQEGAFEAALRLMDRFGLDRLDDLLRGTRDFADLWVPRIDEREQRLKTLAKVDYMHQGEIAQHLSWCEISRSRLQALRSGAEIHDLAEIPGEIGRLDKVVKQIVSKIRQDQMTRIDQYRTEQNAEEAEALKRSVETLAVEAVEDRIAQLRDGRSAAVFETDLSGLVGVFTGEFLSHASREDWPTTPEAWLVAVSEEGPLHIEEDRRSAGLELIGLFRDISKSIASRNPNMKKLPRLLEEIGYDGVKLHNPRAVGRTTWSVDMSGTIRTGTAEEWFLPPVFGSLAAGGMKLLLIGPDTLPEMIVKTLTSDVGVILLYAGVLDRVKRHELAQGLRAKAIPALLIDEAVVAFAATRREVRARTVFECGLPYGRVEPYTTDAGRLPPEMFFGRGEEIRLIMSKTADGCLVYGGRQLGKSALLGHIARTQHAPEEDRIVVSREVRALGNAEKTSEIWAHLASMLSPHVVKPGSRTADQVSKDIVEWTIQKPNGRVVAMFDEADRFMDADTKDDYPELARLKKLMEETGRAFKVVFAGLHNVQRMFRQPNSPLAHLGQPICIGPLNRTAADKRAAYDLVVNPMRAAGFCFESHEAVEQILSWANYYPSLVQEYMKGLLATLHGTGSGKAYRVGDDGPLWPIETDMLFSHRTFGHIEHRIREKFHLTLNLDPRYALVAYTLGRLIVEGREYEARVVGLEPGALLEEASLSWPKFSQRPSPAAFEALLEELFDLGILGRATVPGTNRHRYLLGTRQVLTMLGSEADIYHALQEIEEKDPAVAYDRAIHRRRYKTGNGSGLDDWANSPLTDLQTERLFHPDAHPVQIVCGLEMLGLSKVGVALKRIAESGRIPGSPERELTVDIVKTPKELRAIVDRRDPSGYSKSIVIFAPDDAAQTDEVIKWVERQPSVLDRRVLPILLLDAADKDIRDIATARAQQTQFLESWAAEMVRMHLHQVEQMELDTKAIRDEIMHVTGGVPAEVIKLIRELRRQADPLAFVKGWRANVSAPDGLFGTPEGKALQLLELYDGKDYETFNELVIDETGKDLVSVGPDLRAMGLISTWNSKDGRIRRSALGNFLCRLVEEIHETSNRLNPGRHG